MSVWNIVNINVIKISIWNYPGVFVFGAVSSAVQYQLFRVDNVQDFNFGFLSSPYMHITSRVLRVCCACHVYGGCFLLWSTCTCVMLACGHAMEEYIWRMGERMRTFAEVLTFKVISIKVNHKLGRFFQNQQDQLRIWDGSKWTK